MHHGGLALDTGFIVHNEPNYPLLTRLFRELGVGVQAAEMSFSVSCGACGLEWSGKRPFAQPRRTVDPRFLSLLAEVVRWLRTARRSLDEADYEERTLDEYVTERRYSRRFRTHYLVPLTSALWSTAPERALEFPAAYAIRFFEHHRMLGFGRHRWRTVTGGAETYVRALLERLGGRVHLGLGVRAVHRMPDGVELRTDDDAARRFDAVVVATHGDEALRLLADPSDEETRVLGAFRTTPNDVVLHTDARFLPRAHGARASWNYQLSGAVKPTVTYYLNALQQLEADDHWCVTLNRTDEIDPETDRGALELPAPALHGREPSRPARAAAPLRRTADVVRGRVPRQRLPRGRPRLRRPRGRRAGGGVVRSALYTGTLVHARREPRRNAFRYPVAYFLLDLDELPELDRRLRFLSVNRPNAVSFHDEDYLDGDGTPLKEAVVRFCAERGRAVERVLTLTQLRVLGYVFNPVTFHWCYGPDGGLACIVAELSNTFGERLPELLDGGDHRYEQAKRLHVSPFFGLDQSYEYAFSEPEDEVWARIHVREEGRRPLTAVLHGRRVPLTNRSLAGFLVRYPLMPVQVIGLIHWQALKLYAKRVPFHHKPPFVPGIGSVRE